MLQCNLSTSVVQLNMMRLQLNSLYMIYGGTLVYMHSTVATDTHTCSVLWLEFRGHCTRIVFRSTSSMRLFVLKSLRLPLPRRMGYDWNRCFYSWMNFVFNKCFTCSLKLSSSIINLL